MQDIDNNRSIIDALASEERFFRNQPVHFLAELCWSFLIIHLFQGCYNCYVLLQAYQDLSHCCGVPQLAKKLNQVNVINFGCCGHPQVANIFFVAFCQTDNSYRKAVMDYIKAIMMMPFCIFFFPPS